MYLPVIPPVSRPGEDAEIVTHCNGLSGFIISEWRGGHKCGSGHPRRVLASRVGVFFKLVPYRRVQAKPLFPGCGWVDDAEGDLLGDRTLIEVKAGDRRFVGPTLGSYCVTAH
jgi:hypothetical protein